MIMTDRLCTQCHVVEDRDGGCHADQWYCSACLAVAQAHERTSNTGPVTLHETLQFLRHPMLCGNVLCADVLERYPDDVYDPCVVVVRDSVVVQALIEGLVRVTQVVHIRHVSPLWRYGVDHWAVRDWEAQHSLKLYGPGMDNSAGY